MKEGSNHKIESKQKIKIARAKQGSNVWNKGLKGYGKYKGEPPCKVLRKDRNYYIEELKKNAVRAKNKGYRDNERSRSLMKKKENEYKNITSVGGIRKDWSQEDIKLLKEIHNLPRVEVCLKLGRSWQSVQHKISRLKLLKYNKWT